MNDQVHGKKVKEMKRNKIGILIENRFISKEIQFYMQWLEGEGYQVVFLTRLWGNHSLNFKSIEMDMDLKVTHSFENMDDEELKSYGAIIVPAGYVADYLLYTEKPGGQSPACKFIDRIMHDKDIVKGFICHSLWIAGPDKDSFKDRTVTCHNNIISHVTNAGMKYEDSDVVKDHDLVTARTGEDYRQFALRISEAIKKKAKKKHEEKTEKETKQMGKGTKKILCIVSEWGYWGEELVGPYDELTSKGYTFDFVSPKGKRPVALPPSMDESYIDPPLDKHVTNAHFARRTKEVNEGNLFDNIGNLSEWFPERPYFNSQNFGHELTAYYEKRAKCWADLEQYDALLLPGGSGPMVDIVNNQRVHDVILGFVAAKKLVAAECYCVTALAFARDWSDRKCIIEGKHVTGHALEYDYKDGTGFAVSELNYGPPFYPLEFILRDAVGRKGQYHGGVGQPTSTILDYPFLTGRSTQDSTLVGQLMDCAITEGLKRYGW